MDTRALKQGKQMSTEAFKSLCFRYGRTARPQEKARIYGGILYVKRETGEREYALVQGSYTGKWSFPKGHSNEGELPLECALREVGEETGIDELPQAQEYIRVGYGHYYVFELKERITLNPRDTKEVINTRWVTMEEMDELTLNADVTQYVQKRGTLRLPLTPCLIKFGGKGVCNTGEG